MSSELQTGKARSLDCSNAPDEDIALDSFIDKACGATPHRPVSKKSKLGDCVDILTGYPFKSAEYSTSESDIKLVRGDNIAQGVLRWDGVKFWPKDKAEGLRDYLLQENDVLLAMDRPWIPAGLKFARLQKQEMPALLVQRVACLRPKAGFDRNFLFSIIASPRFADYIKNVSTGTAVPHISSKQIREFEFDRLEPEQEKAVGDFHFYIDDRIALLRETNATLEAMAQALFKSWFVDFDPVHANAGNRAATLPAELQALFPSTFTDTPQGPVPEGWCVKPCREIIDVRDGTHASPKPSETGYPLVTSRHITSGEISLDGTYLISDAEYLDISRRSRVDYLDVLITMIGTVGIPALVLSKSTDFAIKNIGLLKTSKKPELSGYIYLLLKSKEMQNYIETHTAGTTQKYLSLKALREIAMIEPAPKIISAFSVNVQLIFEKIHENNSQVQTLATLRDTLLPRLISGQLRLPDAAAALAEAGV